MKKIILLLLAILSQRYYSQEYPLDYKGDTPNGAYYKDLNGELNKYIGVWKGDWSGKTIYIELKKNKKYYAGNNAFYQDEIVGERKIINSNGVVEVDRISTFDLLNSEFWGISTNLKHGNIKRMYFYPKNMCGLQASVDIMNFTGTQMTLHMEYLPNFKSETCQHNAYITQYNDWPINFPKDITLTKQ